MPKFSVVISVYNKEQYIAATLQSVLDQTFQDFEIVILNDGSTDNSELEILKFTDSRISYFSEANQGAAAGRNYVIKKAKGEFIALLDADDYWYPNHLAELNISIAQFPEEAVFANAIEISENNTPVPVGYSFEQNQEGCTVLNYFKASMMSSTLHSSNFAVVANLFKEVGYYNSNYITGEDTDFYVRLGLKYTIVFNPKVTVRFYKIDDGLNFSNRTIKGKATFKEYESLEKDNLALKKFLDINRYSLCIIAKLEGDVDSFKNLYSKIDEISLNRKQQFLIKQPKSVLQVMLKSKDWLERAGIRLSAFK